MKVELLQARGSMTGRERVKYHLIPYVISFPLMITSVSPVLWSEMGIVAQMAQL